MVPERLLAWKKMKKDKKFRYNVNSSEMVDTKEGVPWLNIQNPIRPLQLLKKI